MSVPGKLSFRMTDDLPRELATWSIGPRLASPSPVQNLHFPGMLLTCAGKLCAAIGFDVEPGGILTITAPIVLGDHDVNAHSEWGRQLLQEVINEAARRRCCVVRFVQPVTNIGHSDAFGPLLSESGFSIRAEIVQWKKTYVLESRFEHSSDIEFQALALPGIAIEAFPGEQLKICMAERDKVLKPLHEILSSTHDLANLASPDAEGLLNDWIRHGAMMIVGSRGGPGIAICVCVPEFDPDNTTMAAFRIQYIGVIPENRCMGVATSLLQRVPWVLSASAITELANEIQLTAFSDTDNRPAMQLYRTCGFQTNADFSIWCHHLV